MKKNHKWQNFKDFIASQDIPEAVKQQETDNRFLKDHQLYLSLFEWLKPIFPELKDSIIQKLSIAGYIYFRTVLLMDQLMDGKNQDQQFTISRLILCLAYHEKAIKELSDMFSSENDFWNDFEKIKKGYIQANLFEKELSQTKVPLTKEQVRKLSAGKSNLCIAAVSALCAASKEENKHRSNLEESLLEMHIGFQYFDDINDFRGDLIQKQWTYATFRVDKFLKANISNYNRADVDTRYKYLFISGIAQEMLKEAKQHFKKSYQLVQNLPLSQYKSFLEEEIKQCEKLSWEVEQTLLKTKTKVKKSRIPKRQSSVTNISKSKIEQSVQSGVSYLRSTIDESYKWHDFLTNAGLGTSWITSYVGYQLSEVNLAEDLLKLVSCNIVDNDMALTGGYNSTMLRDGDSLNFTIGFLKELCPEKNLPLLKTWFHFQKNDNKGWVTYNKPNELRERLELEPNDNVEGWTMSHPCVSAGAACILNKLNTYRNRYERTIEHLAECQAKTGEIPSYWWTSSIYSTSFAVMAFDDNKKIQQNLLKSKKWLLSQQDHDGSWTAQKEGKGNAFYTALALKALLKKPSGVPCISIERGIKWLLNHQLKDGSWPVTRVLRIPAPDVTNPEKVNRWRKSSFGVNALIDDHIGNFTTSTVVNVLEYYRKCKYELTIGNALEYYIKSKHKTKKLKDEIN